MIRKHPEAVIPLRGFCCLAVQISVWRGSPTANCPLCLCPESGFPMLRLQKGSLQPMNVPIGFLRANGIITASFLASAGRQQKPQSALSQSLGGDFFVQYESIPLRHNHPQALPPVPNVHKQTANLPGGKLAAANQADVQPLTQQLYFSGRRPSIIYLIYFIQKASPPDPSYASGGTFYSVVS